MQIHFQYALTDLRPPSYNKEVSQTGFGFCVPGQRRSLIRKLALSACLGTALLPGSLSPFRSLCKTVSGTQPYGVSSLMFVTMARCCASRSLPPKVIQATKARFQEPTHIFLQIDQNYKKIRVILTTEIRLPPGYLTELRVPIVNLYIEQTTSIPDHSGSGLFAAGCF